MVFETLIKQQTTTCYEEIFSVFLVEYSLSPSMYSCFHEPSVIIVRMTVTAYNIHVKLINLNINYFVVQSKLTLEATMVLAALHIKHK